MHRALTPTKNPIVHTAFCLICRACRTREEEEEEGRRFENWTTRAIKKRKALHLIVVPFIVGAQLLCTFFFFFLSI